MNRPYKVGIDNEDNIMVFGKGNGIMEWASVKMCVSFKNSKKMTVWYYLIFFPEKNGFVKYREETGKPTNDLI